MLNRKLLSESMVHLIITLKFKNDFIYFRRRIFDSNLNNVSPSDSFLVLFCLYDFIKIARLLLTGMSINSLCQCLSTI